MLVFFFLVVTVGGFIAARWRRPDSMASLDEWGLGGRGFGTLTTWFLLGGDLYTAYTFVAVPAAMYATGAVSGWFAVPYTILVYPLIFVFMPRMWSVAHRRGYVTPADFVRGRYGSRGLSLAVALTGILATMPYIALQLVGIQAVIDTVGLGGSSNAFLRDLPLIIAFAVLAAYTYSSGLRAPALIAFVKDTLVYIVIVAAIIYVGTKIGFGTMFHAAETKMNTVTPAGKKTGIFIPDKNSYWAYATLAFGSAMALFMYPHAMTATLSSKSRNVIRRNAAILPTYSLMLALLALLGFAAIANKTSVFGSDGFANAQLAVPHFFAQVFPDWFAGVAFAAIAIGALVPAAIMSIAAANLFTRNIYREFIRPDAEPHHEAAVSKIASLVVKFGALAFVLFMDRQNAINMQLLGGVWILQTIPCDRGRALHAVVPPVGIAGGLGGRDGLGHGHRLSAEGAEHEGQAGGRQAGHRATRHASLRQLAGQFPVHAYAVLHRDLGARDQHRDRRRVDRGTAGREGTAGADGTEPADYYSDPPWLRAGRGRRSRPGARRRELRA